MPLWFSQRNDRVIPEHQVPEENKRALAAFRSCLENKLDEAALDQYMADVTLYVLEYAAEGLNSARISEANAFDVHCFLADYAISHVPDCSPETIRRIIESLCAFMEFLAGLGRISLVDLEEIFALCADPDPYIARLEEYRELIAAHDLIGLQRWRAQVLEPFERNS